MSITTSITIGFYKPGSSKSNLPIGSFHRNLCFGYTRLTRDSYTAYRTRHPTGHFKMGLSIFSLFHSQRLISLVVLGIWGAVSIWISNDGETCRTDDEGVPNDAGDAEAAAKLEGHVNVKVGRESVADAKQQQEKVREQDHEAATEPEVGWRCGAGGWGGKGNKRPLVLLDEHSCTLRR